MGDKQKFDDKQKYGDEKNSELFEKIQKLENEIAVLTDKVKTYEDPNQTPRIIRKGNQRGTKYQSNKMKVSPTAK